MATLWNPDQLLNISGMGKYGKIQCSGRNKGDGQRCRFQKWTSDADCIAVQRLLPSLAAKPLSEVTYDDLLDLAELCLCRDWHYVQKQRVANEWDAKISHAISQLQAPVAPPRLQTPEPLAPTFSMAAPAADFGMPTPPSTQTSSRNTSFTFECPAPPSFAMAGDRDPDTVASLQMRLDTLQRDFDETRRSLGDAQSALDDVCKQLAASTESLAAANGEIKKKQGVEQWAEAQIKAKLQAETELSALRSQAETHRRDMQALEDRLAAQSRQAADELRRLEDGHAEKLAALSQEHDGAKRQLGRTVLQKQKELEALRHDLGAANERLQLEQGESAARILALQRELDDERRRRAQSDDARANLEVELRRASGEREAAARLREDNADLKRQVEHLEAVAQRSASVVSNLHAQLLAAQETTAGRELVLAQRSDDRRSWTLRMRGWLKQLKLRHAGKVSMRHEIV